MVARAPKAHPASIAELLVATTNEGKVRELRALLADTDVRLLRPADLGREMDVEETGSTFAENALIKARAWFETTGMPTLAEDSGIEIDALGGEPGVYSARYLGLPDGAIKNARVLELLCNVPQTRRACRYHCVAALVTDDATVTFDGRCAGRVAYEQVGDGGFGYDPIFWIPRFGRTMAELSDAEKNQISHRGRAIRKLARFLKQR